MLDVFKDLVQDGVFEVFPVFLVLMNALWVQYKLFNKACTIGLTCQSLHWVHAHLKVCLHFSDVFLSVLRGIYFLQFNLLQL